MPLFRRLAVTASALTLGCGSGAASLSTSSDATTISVDVLYSSFIKTSRVNLAAWSAVPLLATYQMAADTSSDARISIPEADVSWSMLHSKLRAGRDEMAILAANYPTFGDLQAAGLITPPSSKMTRAEFKGYLQSLGESTRPPSSLDNSSGSAPNPSSGATLGLVIGGKVIPDASNTPLSPPVPATRRPIVISYPNGCGLRTQWPDDSSDTEFYNSSTNPFAKNVRPGVKISFNGMRQPMEVGWRDSGGGRTDFKLPRQEARPGTIFNHKSLPQGVTSSLPDGTVLDHETLLTLATELTRPITGGDCGSISEPINHQSFGGGPDEPVLDSIVLRWGIEDRL